MVDIKQLLKIHKQLDEYDIICNISNFSNMVGKIEFDKAVKSELIIKTDKKTHAGNDMWKLA